ncbi:hypothetical protein HCUR_01013 [Holospora curviuscula]|uniref:Uncharacterized protein n=1 Tax=Holospora curviuscula TaxID=1082868 RepID=A0A2S5R8N4_9PROT|nr:hypothetical protein HCUR_01013 [Holospora curviuscula]
MRVLAAAAQALEGASASQIHACDEALDNALQHNFVLAVPVASGLLEAAAVVGGTIATLWAGEKIVDSLQQEHWKKKEGLNPGSNLRKKTTQAIAAEGGIEPGDEDPQDPRDPRDRNTKKEHPSKNKPCLQKAERRNLTQRKTHDAHYRVEPRTKEERATYKLGERFKGWSKEERVQNFLKDHRKENTGFVEEVRLADNRIRKYGPELPSKPGQKDWSCPNTRGSRLEVEYNPVTQNYKETTVHVDHNGQVIRAHPVFRNGQEVKNNMPHYPATKGGVNPQKIYPLSTRPKEGDGLLDNRKYPVGPLDAQFPSGKEE